MPAWLTGELRCGRRLEEAAGSAARGTGEDDGVRLRELCLEVWCGPGLPHST